MFCLVFVRIDGGVSRNDFIVQQIANLTGKLIERRTSSEMSAFGIAFLSGLYSGTHVSQDREPILRLSNVQLQRQRCGYRNFLESRYYGYFFLH
jgi:glycerol kinase